MLSLVNGLAVSLVDQCSVHPRFRENYKLEVSQLGALSHERDLGQMASWWAFFASPTQADRQTLLRSLGTFSYWYLRFLPRFCSFVACLVTLRLAWFQRSLLKPATSLTGGLGASFKCMGTSNLIFTFVTQQTFPVRCLSECLMYAAHRLPCMLSALKPFASVLGLELLIY